MYRLKRHNVVKETDSPVRRDQLIEKGFRLLPDEAKAAETTFDEDEDDKPLEEMTVAELKQVAKENNIDISGAKLKNEILAIIMAAAPAEGDTNDEAGVAESETDQNGFEGAAPEAGQDGVADDNE